MSPFSFFPTRHPTRNPTTDHTRAVTRSQSTKEDDKRPKRTRQKTSDRIEQHLVAAAQKLSDNVQGVYGRQPSSSTYELPLEKKFDEEFSMTDFASGPSSKGISSRSSRQSSQTSNSSAEATGTAPMPLNTRTVSASEDIVPPTPASVTNSRPQSSLFTFDEGQLNTTIEEEAEERRQQAIASITNDLIAISNTPQFQDATSNFQTDLRNLFAPNATSLNQENAYRRLMSPLKRVLEQSTNISQENLVETLIASARIIAYIPSLARFIWSYITSTLNLSIQDLDAYAQNNNDSDSDEGSAV
ncbi:Oidioi.mRNA.OKI2018_I69.PAR.g10287.t1.cds [Oikopleura dioica]|uniref:Oidioi.mRNA.OKI2018_I69.PAR.g10287.t1.cds n=1 Tax=Oikopleura dioica TaxID=34765 RepID=A0ABN7RTH4_OIKDI|nr:Oidioi.mRNA.OKI2018_I69.PAR.g10287.t1.cds [Oikopleura dioica]